MKCCRFMVNINARHSFCFFHNSCYGPDVLYEVIVQVSAVHAILELFRRFYKILKLYSFVDIYSIIDFYLFLMTVLAITDVDF